MLIAESREETEEFRKLASGIVGKVNEIKEKEDNSVEKIGSCP